MAGDLNRVLLSGRLGADPEGRRTRTPCVVFRVAANRLERGGEHTESVTAWANARRLDLRIKPVLTRTEAQAYVGEVRTPTDARASL